MKKVEKPLVSDSYVKLKTESFHKGISICVCSVQCHSLPASCYPAVFFVDVCWFYKIIHYLTYDCNILCLFHVQCFLPNHRIFYAANVCLLQKSNTTLFLIYCLVLCVMSGTCALSAETGVKELLSKKGKELSRFSCRRNT